MSYDIIILCMYATAIYTCMTLLFAHNITKIYLRSLKEITIVRGVPGSGKDFYVDYIEKQKNDKKKGKTLKEKRAEKKAKKK